MPIDFATPDTILEVESEPVGPLVVHGRGNIVRIGKNVRLGATVWLRGDNSLLEIEDDCDIMGVIHIVRGGARLRIGKGTTATGVGIALHEPGEITIGAGCMISTEVHMDVSDVHPIYDAITGERINPPKPIVIGDRVWLGGRVLVLKGATIGEGAIVGAGSIVVGDIPANCLAAGSPAKPMRRNVVWKRDFEEPPLGTPGAAPAEPLPAGFHPQMVMPFEGAPPAAVSGSEVSRDERMGVRVEELPRGRSPGLELRPGYSPSYLDKAGAAFDPLNNPAAATSAAEPIDLRGFALDGATLARGVDLVIDGAAYAARYGLPRGDVAKDRGDASLAPCGFVLTLAPNALPTGRHTVTVRVLTADEQAYYEGPEVAFEVV